jgi:hypothetical protein
MRENRSMGVPPGVFESVATVSPPQGGRLGM